MEEMKPKLTQLINNGWVVYVPLPPHDLLLKQGSQRLVHSKEIEDFIFQYTVNYKGDVIRHSFLLNKETNIFDYFIERIYSKMLFTHTVE